MTIPSPEQQRDFAVQQLAVARRRLLRLADEPLDTVHDREWMADELRTLAGEIADVVEFVVDEAAGRKVSA